MTVTISRLYDDYATASRVVSELEAAGVPHSDISIVASNADNWYATNGNGRTIPGATTGVTTARVDRDRDGVNDKAEGAGAGAGIGAAVGGGAGLLAGLGLMAIPGVGPVVAAGWLVATAVGALAGGATGGVIGALTQAGVSNDDAQVYAEGVRRGGTLVSVRVPDADRSRLEAILNNSAVNITGRRDAYRQSGWSRFDETAPPYTSDQNSPGTRAIRFASDLVAVDCLTVVSGRPPRAATYFILRRYFRRMYSSGEDGGVAVGVRSAAVFEELFDQLCDLPPGRMGLATWRADLLGAWSAAHDPEGFTGQYLLFTFETRRSSSTLMTGTG